MEMVVSPGRDAPLAAQRGWERPRSHATPPFGPAVALVVAVRTDLDLLHPLRMASRRSRRRVGGIVERLRAGKPIIGPSVPAADVRVLVTMPHGAPAFAMGPYTFINEALLDVVTEPGLAFIIAHELAHVVEGHTIERRPLEDRHGIELRADALADRWCRAAGWDDGAHEGLLFLAREGWNRNAGANRCELLFPPLEEGPVRRWLRRRLVSHPTVGERAIALGVVLPMLG